MMAKWIMTQSYSTDVSDLVSAYNIFKAMAAQASASASA